MALVVVAEVVVATGVLRLVRQEEPEEGQLALREVLDRVVEGVEEHRLQAARAEANLARLEALAAVA